MFCAKLLSWVESKFSKNFHKIKSNNRLLKIFAPTKTVVLHCTNGRTRVQNYRVNQMCKLDLGIQDAWTAYLQRIYIFGRCATLWMLSEMLQIMHFSVNSNKYIVFQVNYYIHFMGQLNCKLKCQNQNWCPFAVF